MGDRISFSFINGKEESIAFFSHWDGKNLLIDVKSFLSELTDKIENDKKTKQWSDPLSRKESNTVMLNFIAWMFRKQKMEWIDSNYYLGKDENDGDNGDNGHFKINVNNKIKDIECPYCDANISKRKMSL